MTEIEELNQRNLSAVGKSNGEFVIDSKLVLRLEQTIVLLMKVLLL